MHDADPITWVNSVLPMAILAALAVLVPLGLVRKQTRSQAEVAVTICASAGIMLLVSALTFAILYAAQGTDVWPAFKVTPIATTWAFIRISGYAALLWVAAQVEDLEPDDPNAEVVELPVISEIYKSGLYFLLPIVVLVCVCRVLVARKDSNRAIGD